MTIPINGEIVADSEAWLYDWFGIACTSPAEVREQVGLADPEDPEVVFEINSPGGDVFSGFELYSFIRGLASKGLRTVAHVTALAASAASTIMSACDNVLVSPVAQVMIHQPSCVTSGNIDDHKDSLRALKSIEEGILNGYVRKCNGKASYDELKRMVDATEWLSAGRAVDIGLADGILYDEEKPEADVPESGTTSTVFSAYKNSAAVNDYNTLMQRYESLVLSGDRQADPRHPIETPLAHVPELGTTNFSPEERRKAMASLLLAHERDISSKG